MAITVSAIRPMAHLPFILSMLRKLDVAAIIEEFLPSHPDNILSRARGRSLGPGNSRRAPCTFQGRNVVGGTLCGRTSGLWWCTPVRWRSRKPGRMPLPMPRKPRRWRTISHASPRSRLRVLPMPGRRLPPMRAVALADVGVGHSSGARIPCAIMSRRSPTRKSAHGGAVRQKTEGASDEVRYRLRVEAEARERAEADNGWTVLATTVATDVCSDAQIVRAYHEQHSTVEHGVRWIKHPAAITPVWLEKPERSAALAMQTVVGRLVYALIQCQVRLFLQSQQPQLPGNKGPTATPTAAVVLALFTQVMMIHVQVDHRGGIPGLRASGASRHGL